jgi:hypothetical protein
MHQNRSSKKPYPQKTEHRIFGAIRTLGYSTTKALGMQQTDF